MVTPEKNACVFAMTYAIARVSVVNSLRDISTYIVRSLAEGGSDLRASVGGTDRKGFVIVLAGKGLANVGDPCNNILLGRIVVCRVVVELTRGYENPTTHARITSKAHLA